MIYWINLLVIPIESLLIQKFPIRKSKQIQLFLLIVFVQWFILATFKGNHVGWDTPTYKHYFLKMSDFGWVYNITVNRLEPFYILINNIVGFFTLNYAVLLGVVAIIIYILILVRIPKYSQIPWLSCFLFVSLGFFNFSINILRQSIALAVLIYSYEFIVNRKIWKFIVCIVIATMFHYTASIFIITYFLYKLPVNYKTFILMCIISIIASNTILSDALDLIISTNEYYEGHIGENTSKGYGMLLMLILTSICSLILLPKHKLNSFGHLWMIMIFTATSLQFFSLKIPILVRVIYYWQVSMIFLFPTTIKWISNNQNRCVVLIYIFLITSIYYNLYVINPGDVNGTVPYEFAF